MINYKKLITSREVREGILRILNFVPDKPMVELQYCLHMGRRLNLKKPIRYTEKLQWYKLYYRDPLMHCCVDKFEVREYVKSKGLEEILIPNYGCWGTTDEIEWEKLPDRFVLKLSTGGGGLNNIFCHDKHNFNREQAIINLNRWLKNARYSKTSPGREWAYDGLTPRIICEDLLEPEDQIGQGLDDYKFFCFNGRTSMKWVDYDRYVNHKRVLFNSNGQRINVRCTHESPMDFVYPEDAFEAMQPIVDKLSEDFPHVRVDLYYTNHRIYFGELTFYSGGGYEPFDPDEYDYLLGKKWILPAKKY